MSVHQWFADPSYISIRHMLWMLLPLCLSVSIVYKTIRVGELASLSKQIAFMVAYIAAGLAGLGVAAWLLVTYWP